jgi:hypothetical protein
MKIVNVVLMHALFSGVHVSSIEQQRAHIMLLLLLLEVDDCTGLHTRIMDASRCGNRHAAKSGELFCC